MSQVESCLLYIEKGGFFQLSNSSQGLEMLDFATFSLISVGALDNIQSHLNSGLDHHQ